MSLTEELKNDLTRNVEKKENLVQSRGLWIQRCEEARWAENAARQAENVCKNDIEHVLASRDAGETRAKEAAGKVWQSSQSSREKGENLKEDLKYILQAMKSCGGETFRKRRRGCAIKFQCQALFFVPQ